MANNSSLHNAKTAKNDEFYTQYQDIEAEMNAYYEYNKDVFRGKTILLPCDDPEWSNFTKYFATNFERFGLKKLISTSYAKSSSNQQISLFEKSSPLFDATKHQTHGKIFVLTKDSNKSGRIDTDDIEFRRYLEGDGDFRSEEVKALRDEADIIITNPPFSLFREFLEWIAEWEKQFIIIGNKNAITYKEVFPRLRNNEMWIGYSPMGKDYLFSMTSDAETNICKFKQMGSGYRIIDNHIMARAQACWFTNIDHGKRHEKLLLDTMEHNLKFNKKLRKKFEKTYGKIEYPHYDNYDAIEVPFTEAIPSDYDGVMGVPITFLDKYNPDQFEIVSFRKGEDGKDLVFTREREREFNRTFEFSFTNDTWIDEQSKRYKSAWEKYICSNHYTPKTEPVDVIFPLATNLKNGLINDCRINGKKTYVRILISPKKGGIS